MKIKKKAIATLTKCYSIAPLRYNDQNYFLVAAEKKDRCILFDLDGKEIDTIWEAPGGVMSMVQVPGSNGQFLATHEFYSPNDSKEAKIVIVTPRSKGKWEIRTLIKLPHVHRFDIVERNGVHYLIACTLKSGHKYKDDWSVPGKVYGAVLPENLEKFDEEHPLEMAVLKDGMLKNHGYYRIREENMDTCIICSENGVFKFIPPELQEKDWKIQTLLTRPASDAVLTDLDQDGEKELVVLSPFHGDQISIYRKVETEYKKVYDYEKKTEFLHAIYGGAFGNKNALVIGHRKGERDLLIFTYNQERKMFMSKVIDHDCGPANVYHFVRDGKDIIISANREKDEVAMYEFSEM